MERLRRVEPGPPVQVTVTAGASVSRNRFSIRTMLQNKQLTNTTTAVVKKFDAVFTPRVAVTKAVGAARSVYSTVGTGYTPPLLSQVVSSNGASIRRGSRSGRCSTRSARRAAGLVRLHRREVRRLQG